MPVSMREVQATLLSYLDSVVSAALSAYSIGLKDLEQRRTTVYSACFLQMYNRMVEGATPGNAPTRPAVGSSFANAAAPPTASTEPTASFTAPPPAATRAMTV